MYKRITTTHVIQKKILDICNFFIYIYMCDVFGDYIFYMMTTPKERDTMEQYTGSLKMIVGPMFSGKSTELLHNINSYISIGKNVLVINHAFNVRSASGENEGITTHDSIPRSETVYVSPHTDCITLLKLSDLLEDKVYTSLVDNASVICIEELQFFQDAQDVVLELVNKKNKKVIVAGLIADYTGHLFGDVGNLIPFADEVHHIKALCNVCNDGTPGIFTQRISPHGDQIAIGAKDMYRTVCRKHYYQKQIAHEMEHDVYQVGYSYADVEQYL